MSSGKIWLNLDLGTTPFFKQGLNPTWSLPLSLKQKGVNDQPFFWVMTNRFLRVRRRLRADSSTNQVWQMSIWVKSDWTQTSGGAPNLAPFYINMLWMVAKSISHHLRNPQMIRFPCKYPPTFWCPLVSKRRGFLFFFVFGFRRHHGLIHLGSTFPKHRRPGRKPMTWDQV